MTPAELKQSALKDARPPAGLGEAALALWYLKKGDWDKSHAIAQDLHDAHGAWIHGLLHLTGYDDTTPAQSRAMRARERSLMRAIGLPCPQRIRTTRGTLA